MNTQEDKLFPFFLVSASSLRSPQERTEAILPGKSHSYTAKNHIKLHKVVLIVFITSSQITKNISVNLF